MLDGVRSISSSLYVGKILTTIEITTASDVNKNKYKSTNMAMSTKLIKACKLIQYSILAALIIAAGDVSPNPGWTCSALNQKGLKIAHLNVRSLPRHFDEFKILMHDNPFDVICLTETWLNSTWTDSELELNGYNLVRDDRVDSQRGGGTAIYYATKLNACQRTNLLRPDIEATWLEILLPNRKKLLVGSIYRPPNMTYNNFKVGLENTLEDISSGGNELLLLGDFNLDMLPRKLPVDARDLRQLFNAYQVTQLIKSPTRVTNNSSTLIDLALTTDVGKIVASGVMQCSISDHSLIYLVRRARKVQTTFKNIQFRNFKKYSVERFVSDLYNVSWEEVDTSLTVNDAWNVFKSLLNNVIEKHAPLQSKRARGDSLPWLTSDIRTMMRKRNFHHKRAQKTKSIDEWKTYKELRNKTTRLIRDTKRDFFSNVINENKKDSAKLWKTLKNVISNKKKSSHIGCLETAFGIAYKSQEIVQGFAQYFQEAVVNIRQNLQPPSPSWISSSTKPNCTFSFSNIDETFVCAQLRKIKTSKSTGLAHIPARLLKDGCNPLAKPLTVLLNRSLAEGTIPSEWKHAMVTPIHKSGSKADVANYRPISVLPVFVKVLERAVHSMVYHYLQENQLLSIYQSGFRPLHSTSTCLIDTTNKILQNVDKGLLTGMVFLDISKAFDTLDHDKMREKLSLLGFNDSAVIWFNNYLTDRTQSITVNGVVSDPKFIQYGVPQGSILGPLLFIIYINELPSVIQNCYSIQLYADDTLLFFSCKSIARIESMLSGDLNRVISWLHSNFLSLNYSKTKIMLIGTHQRLAKVDSFNVEAQNTELDRVYKFKYLGVVLDPWLSWNDHIDYITTKISSRLGMLRKARKVVPRESCITLYDAMILPLFDYCSAVWANCGKTNCDFLDRLQRRAVSIIEGRRVQQSDVFHTLSWPSLQSRREYQICLQVFKSLHGLAPAYLLHEFNYSREFHAYNTRHRDQLRLPLAKTTKYQNSFRYNGAKTWNMLPLRLRTETSFLKFKIDLKKFLKARYI